MKQTKECCEKCLPIKDPSWVNHSCPCHCSCSPKPTEDGTGHIPHGQNCSLWVEKSKEEECVHAKPLEVCEDCEDWSKKWLGYITTYVKRCAPDMEEWKLMSIAGNLEQVVIHNKHKFKEPFEKYDNSFNSPPIK